MSDRYGFTLIELLVVVSILALLVTIALPGLAHVRALARKAVCQSQMKAFATAIGSYISQYGTYPHAGCGWDRGWPKTYALLEMMGVPGSHKTHGLTSYENLLPMEIQGRAQRVLCPAMDPIAIWETFADTAGAHPQCKVDYHPAAIGYQWNITLRCAEGPTSAFPTGRYPPSPWRATGDYGNWDNTFWVWYPLHLKDNAWYLAQAVRPQEVGNPAYVAEGWDGMDLGTVPRQVYWNNWDYEGTMAGWHVGPQTFYANGWAVLPGDRHPGASPNILYVDGSVRSDAARRLTAQDVPAIAARCPAQNRQMHLVSWDDYADEDGWGTVRHVAPRPWIHTGPP